MKDDEEYRFPEKIELDDEAFEEFSGEVQNPRQPTGRLRALFDKYPPDELAARRSEDRTFAELVAGRQKLPRKYGAYDVIMIVVFLAALVALVLVLGACGGGQKCWQASPAGGGNSPGGEKNCRSQQ